MIKKTILLLTLCITLPAFAQKTLTILHTNDVHSRIEAVSPESPDTEALGENYFDLWDNSDLFKFLINPIIGF